jgi:hypothetical protein
MNGIFVDTSGWYATIDRHDAVTKPRDSFWKTTAYDS